MAYIEKNKITKVEAFDNQKFDKVVNFEELKKYKLSFEKNEYRDLYNVLQEKKLYTYKEIGEKLNIHPRKVAILLKKNKLLILIPCHRVIKSDGDLGGYILGKKVKEKILSFEGLI